ncbi:MAG: hypothetical protein AB1760_02655 [Pseudomonadota bacterium]
MNQDGLPLRIVLTAGQASDKAAVAHLIDDLAPAQRRWWPTAATTPRP